MSMSFKNPLTEEDSEFLRERLGDMIEAMDEHTVLLNSKEIKQLEMKEVANRTNQVVTVEVNDLDEVKTMSDGTQYKVTASGWKKL